ncbi:NAD-dependent epimerase/dehydratase family protein [bacterium]|nr:NAD-dependent epimerase/dehydratase family protein [bacterium]
MTRYFFLTGATGLLGNYLLRDLLLADQPVAVLVRSNRRMSARQRMENLLLHWDRELGRPLPRPVVLEGDITQPDLGLNACDLRWATEYCTAIVNNAASLSFEATSSEGEPYRSNVTGTQNVLEFARQADIREFHHVSTAYIAGLRSGKVLESEVDVGQKLGNDYETSKLTAEKMVRSADFINPPTVYRPGIIIGDTQTGFTTTYHGFYAALQLTHTLASTHERDERGLVCASDVRLNLNGDETKHLVPVDWVAAAMVRIIQEPQLHGQTYHLTPRVPVTTRVIRDVLEESIGMYGTQLCGADHAAEKGNEAEALFHEHIRVYNSYWRNDPQFDDHNIRTALPDLPCPDVDHDLLLRLSRQAIAADFPTPPKKPLTWDFDVAAAIESWADDQPLSVATRAVLLDVRGAGGGQWQLLANQHQLMGIEQGQHPDCRIVCQTDATTFGSIARSETTWPAAIAAGTVTFAGDETASEEAIGLLEQLVGVAV